MTHDSKKVFVWEGDLVLWDNEGGRSASSITIDDKDIDIAILELFKTDPTKEKKELGRARITLEILGGDD